jgi:hypothetical protein
MKSQNDRKNSINQGDFNQDEEVKGSTGPLTSMYNSKAGKVSLQSMDGNSEINAEVSDPEW